MMRSWTYLILAITIPTLAVGQTTIQHDHLLVDVRGNGRFCRTTRTVTVRLDRDALGDFETLVAHESSFRRLERFDVTVTSASGEKLRSYDKGDATSVPSHPGYVLYGDERAYLLDVDVRPGDVLRYEITHEIDPVLALPEWSFGGEYPIQVSEYELHVPSGYTFKHRQDAGAPTPTVSADSTHWRWRAENVPALAYFERCREAPSLDVAPGFLPGGPAFDSWCDLAAYFADDYARARDAADGPTGGDVAASADSISTVLAIATELGNRLDYVAVEVGWGAWLPPVVDETLELGYGDCKAMANALVAELHAHGFEAYPALVGTRGAMTNPDPSFPTFGHFDHAITMVVVAGDTLWIDLTDPASRHGQLPWNVQGRLALPLSPGCRGLVETAVAPPETNVRSIDVRGRIGPDGALHGQLRVRMSGSEAAPYRRELGEPLTPREALGLALGEPPTTAFDAIDFTVDEASGDVEIRAALHLERALRRLGASGALSMPVLERLYRFDVPVSICDETPRTFDYRRRLEERIALDITPFSGLRADVDSVHVHRESLAAWGTAAAYTVADTLVLTRELTSTQLTIPLEDHASVQRVVTDIRTRRQAGPPLRFASEEPTP